MGVTDYVPQDWGIVESLSPAEFHERLCDRVGKERKVLVDVRNYYESRIGYFVDPVSGNEAVRPGVRRFGQWPQFVKANVSQFQIGEEEEIGREGKATRYLTYCTGGIRCEKGARFLAENLSPPSPGIQDTVCTLKGGIQAYLMWMDGEIKSGRKTADESLFKGKNYVFDARGSTGLESESTGEGEKVAKCHVCKTPEDRLSKCRSKGCHLILVVCEQCEEGDVRCCRDCLALDEMIREGKGERPRSICECERERERKLWGDKTQSQKMPGKRNRRKFGDGGTNGINIQIKTID